MAFVTETWLNQNINDEAVQIHGYSLIRRVVYHPPSSNNNTLIEHLTIKLDAALSMYPNAGILLVEDFNKCPVSAILRHFTLEQIVKQPTRGNATLDLILTNMSDFCNTPLVIPTIGCSDHDSVLCSYKEGKTKNVHTKVKIRQGNNAAKSAFGKWLSHFNWTVLYHTICCEQKLDFFQDVISTGLDCMFPPDKNCKIG